MEDEAASDEGLEPLLAYLRDVRGFDFTGYKRPTLRRRIQRRLQDLGIDGYAAYQDHLEVHPDEFTTLFNTILINVTDFLRDDAAWQALREQVIPAILSGHGGSSPTLRIWSAACATGQETYSLAMLFAEAMGADEFGARVKIYGTDVDESALEQARRASYRRDELEALPDDLVQRYFDESGDDRFTFDRDLRRAVIFGRHDLVRDAPISRLDLLVCRNTLMYFNADVQRDILRRFHFAMREDGFLFLGKAETLLTTSELYEPVDLRHRIFRRRPGSDVVGAAVARRSTGRGPDGHSDAFRSDLVVAAFGSSPVPNVVVGEEGFVVAINGAARESLGLRAADLGRPFHDLDLSYRPADLRSAIDRALEAGAERVESVELTVSGQVRWFDVDVLPLRDGDHHYRGVSVTFTDVSRHRQLERELNGANRELESTSQELQSSNEELETTNEELQSSNEELETTNEELQSSNEELETMNEELQATNAELEAMNDILQERGDELDDLNGFLQSILRSLRSAVVVVDTDMLVTQWSDKAQEQWGLRSDEVVGTHLLNLDIGLPAAELRVPLKRCLERDAELVDVEIEARDRRGRAVVCQVRFTPLIGRDDAIRGCILLLETHEPPLVDSTT